MKSSTPLIADMTSPPVVGKFYLVPHVFYVWSWYSWCPHWWPVAGPKHEDAEHLNFPSQHYHLDRRFIPERIVMSVARCWNGRDTERTFAGGPVSEFPPQLVHGRKVGGPLPAPVLRRAQCRQASVGFPALSSTAKSEFPRFHERYLGKSCAQDGEGHALCPHKGLRLSSLTPNEHGQLICPLHGLAIDPQTKRVVERVEVQP